MINKLLFASCLLFVVSIAFSQSETSNVVGGLPTNKNGVVIAPEAGDFMIGINASPFLEFAGNMFKLSDQVNNAPSFGFTSDKPGMIYGKYMLSNTKGVRVAVKLGMSSNTTKDGSGTSSEDPDLYKTSSSNLGISCGYEVSPLMRSRIRGYYGGQLGIDKKPFYGAGYSGRLTEGTIKYIDAQDAQNNYVEKGGNTIGFIVGGFVGIEYFIAPKLSISGEYQLNLALNATTKRVYTPEVGEDVVVYSGGNSAGLENVSSGTLNLLFYF